MKERWNMSDEARYIELKITEKPESAEDDSEGDGVYIKTTFETPSNHVDYSKNIFEGNYLVIETKFIGSWDWTEEELCMVCKLPLKRSHHDEDIVKCPYCGAKAHKKHLFDWLRIRNSCPFCRRELSKRSVLYLDS
jgi:rubrerythrin